MTLEIPTRPTKCTLNGVKYEKYGREPSGRPEVATLSLPDPILRLPLGSLRSPIFPPVGSLVPGLNMAS